ncbi:unnamed protein product, partial [marine sediment metagenome]
WNFIFQNYVDRERLDVDALSQAAIKGMVEALDDPYTSYLDAEAYQLSLSNLEGKLWMAIPSVRRTPDLIRDDCDGTAGCGGSPDFSNCLASPVPRRALAACSSSYSWGTSISITAMNRMPIKKAILAVAKPISLIAVPRSSVKEMYIITPAEKPSRVAR